MLTEPGGKEQISGRWAVLAVWSLQHGRHIESVQVGRVCRLFFCQFLQKRESVYKLLGQQVTKFRMNFLPKERRCVSSKRSIDLIQEIFAALVEA